MQTRPQKSSKFLRKKALIGIAFLCCQNFIQAQSGEPGESSEQAQLSGNGLYVEGGFGTTSQVSINYERKIYSVSNINFYGRVGLGYSERWSPPLLKSRDNKSTHGNGALAAIVILVGKDNKYFELNLGTFIGQGTYAFTGNTREEKVVFVHSILNFGYRYQKPEGGLIFSAKAGLIEFRIGLGYAF